MLFAPPAAGRGCRVRGGPGCCRLLLLAAALAGAACPADAGSGAGVSVSPPAATAVGGSKQPLTAPAAADPASRAAAASPSETDATADAAGAAGTAGNAAAAAAAPTGGNAEADTPATSPEIAAAASVPASEAAASPAAWETSFAWGLRYSKLAVDGPEPSSLAWAFDTAGSAAAVPAEMLRAEALLQEGSANASPAAKQKEKKAEQALRMYYHAKWLAERNYERAAEWRYREASRIARESKRSVLAAHSMSRLGYFFMHWMRFDEAREALRESVRLNTKSNPLGPFLYGVLERRTAAHDPERLRAAEERILEAGQQPSEELEAQRLELTRQIHFWRTAGESPARCALGIDVVEVLVCLSTHLARRLFG